MYEGTNKIALQSQEMIAEAFMKELKNKPFNKISISELCNKALVSRQTFYSVFDSKENILYYEYKKRYLNLSSYFIAGENLSIPNLIHVFIDYISEYKDFFTILVHNNLLEILNKGLQESLFTCEVLAIDKDNLKNQYAIAFVSGALVEIANKYITNGSTDDLKVIEELLIDLFQG
ncbi:MAG: TetR/AcrR family transcriptional regulator, partial [Sarcina sp.]